MVAWSFEDSVIIPGWWLNLERSRQDSSVILLYFLSAPMIDTVPPLVRIHRIRESKMEINLAIIFVTLGRLLFPVPMILSLLV